MDGMRTHHKTSGISSKIHSILRTSITSKRRSLLQDKYGITVRRYFLSAILVLGVAACAPAASVITGYVQSYPPGVQSAAPNVSSVTAGQITDRGLSVGGCVQ